VGNGSLGVGSEIGKQVKLLASESHLSIGDYQLSRPKIDFNISQSKARDSTL
jgi:hypothetical protein